MNKYKEIWYEVFISDEYGSISIESFDTLEEAKKYRKQYLKKHPEDKGNIWIDKWASKDGGWDCEQLEHCSI